MTSPPATPSDAPGPSRGPDAAAPPTLRLGCAALGVMVIGVACVFVGLLFCWQASDDAALAAAAGERGERVTVEVTGVDRTRSAAGVQGSRTTQFWLEVVPVPPRADDSEGADGAGEAVSAPPARVAVSQAEHDGAVIGTRMKLWRIDDAYHLDRIVSEPTSPAVGYALLGAGGAGVLTALVLIRVLVVRVRRAAFGS